MKCQDRDPNLLLFGLGNLSRWERWMIVRHLRGCARCRARQRQLAMLSRQIALALWPPGDRGGGTAGPGIPTRLNVTRSMLRPLLLALILSLLSLYYMNLRNVRAHAMACIALPRGACRPDLPNDRCR